MNRLVNLAIAVALAACLFAALSLAEASSAGLDFVATRIVLSMALSLALFAGFNAPPSNRPVPVAHPARQVPPVAFPPRPGMGWIVVMRDKRNLGGALGFDMSVNDRIIARVMQKCFTLLAVPAGIHRLVADTPAASGTAAVVQVDITITPGAVRMFAIRTSMELAHVMLRLDPVADSSAVRAELAGMSLVKAEGRADLISSSSD
jgi:hypothetical protein